MYIINWLEIANFGTSKRHRILNQQKMYLQIIVTLKYVSCMFHMVRRLFQCIPFLLGTIYKHMMVIHKMLLSQLHSFHVYTKCCYLSCTPLVYKMLFISVHVNTKCCYSHESSATVIISVTLLS